MEKTEKTEGERRLLKLAGFLRELPSGRFDYTQWVGKEWQGREDLSCGTVACALGWATAIPEFRKLGLSLRAYRHGNGGSPMCMDSRGKEYHGDFAAVHFFDLTYSEADYLFHPGFNECEATAAEVADKIEYFVEHRLTFPGWLPGNSD